MSQSDAPKPKPPDWGTLGWLIVALFLFIIAIGNASGFGDDQNQPSPPNLDQRE